MSLSMSSVWIWKLGTSLFWKVPISLSEFRQDINRLSPFHSSHVAVSRPCHLLEFTHYRALLIAAYGSKKFWGNWSVIAVIITNIFINSNVINTVLSLNSFGFTVEWVAIQQLTWCNTPSTFLHYSCQLSSWFSSGVVSRVQSEQSCQTLLSPLCPFLWHNIPHKWLPRSAYWGHSPEVGTKECVTWQCGNDASLPCSHLNFELAVTVKALLSPSPSKATIFE